jgi:hypothetical protein
MADSQRMNDRPKQLLLGGPLVTDHPLLDPRLRPLLSGHPEDRPHRQPRRQQRHKGHPDPEQHRMFRRRH